MYYNALVFSARFQACHLPVLPDCLWIGLRCPCHHSPWHHLQSQLPCRPRACSHRRFLHRSSLPPLHLSLPLTSPQTLWVRHFFNNKAKIYSSSVKHGFKMCVRFIEGTVKEWVNSFSFDFANVNLQLIFWSYDIRFSNQFEIRENRIYVYKRAPHKNKIILQNHPFHVNYWSIKAGELA